MNVYEFKEMKRGVIYWKAHQIALQKEKEIGLLNDPDMLDFEQEKF